MRGSVYKDRQEVRQKDELERLQEEQCGETIAGVSRQALVLCDTFGWL